MSLDDVNLLGAGRERVEDGVAPLSRAESLASVGHRALSRTESLASVGHGTLSWAQSKSADGHGSLHDEAAETTVLVPMENHEPRLPDIDGVEVVHAAFSRTESASAKSDAALSHRALGELLFVFPVVVLIGSNRLDLIGCRSIENDHIESLCSNCLRNTSRLTTHRSVNSVVNLDRNGLAVYLAENGEEHNASSSHGFRTMREEENESEGLVRSWKNENYSGGSPYLYMRFCEFMGRSRYVRHYQVPLGFLITRTMLLAGRRRAISWRIAEAWSILFHEWRWSERGGMDGHEFQYNFVKENVMEEFGCERKNISCTFWSVRR